MTCWLVVFKKSTGALLSRSQLHLLVLSSISVPEVVQKISENTGFHVFRSIKLKPWFGPFFSCCERFGFLRSKNFIKTFLSNWCLCEVFKAMPLQLRDGRCSIWTLIFVIISKETAEIGPLNVCEESETLESVWFHLLSRKISHKPRAKQKQWF